MVDGSHTECSDESTLCIGVLFHFEGWGVKISLEGQRQNYDFGQFQAQPIMMSLNENQDNS